jgi:AcrR family transcriptional regulator
MTPSRQKSRRRGEYASSASGLAQQNGSPSPQVSDMQRQRILIAMASVTCRDGLSAVTVSRIIELAKVGRRSFYELFDGREDCLLALFDHAVSLAEERARPAFEAEHAWADRLRAGLLAILDFFDDEPQLARVCVVHALAGGPEVLARRNRALSGLTRLIDEGHVARQTTSAISPLTAEGVLGAVAAVVHARMLQPTQEPLRDLLNPLMAIVVLPYLGTRGARRELARPAPRSEPMRALPSFRSSDPLAGIGIRVTYRTTCVLAAIASAPGASNRQIADAAGINDQGQMSKLLSRLEGFKLVRNSGAGQPEGMSNAWTLTAKGDELAQALSGNGGRAIARGG